MGNFGSNALYSRWRIPWFPKETDRYRQSIEELQLPCWFSQCFGYAPQESKVGRYQWRRRAVPRVKGSLRCGAGWEEHLEDGLKSGDSLCNHCSGMPRFCPRLCMVRPSWNGSIEVMDRWKKWKADMYLRFQRNWWMRGHIYMYSIMSGSLIYYRPVWFLEVH